MRTPTDIAAATAQVTAARAALEQAANEQARQVALQLRHRGRPEREVLRAATRAHDRVLRKAGAL